MVKEEIDVGRYFQRIGYDDDGRPSLAALKAIQARHTEAIAFENIDPLLGRPVLLDSASLARKLVDEGRGGYCFEHNLLFKHVLETLGWRVYGLAARVLWNRPDEEAIAPRSHMLLRVELEDESYIVDVGFGGRTPTAPLRLDPAGEDPGVEQATPHEPFRLQKAGRDGAGDDFDLQCRIGDAWKTLYRFDLQRQQACDYTFANHYLSTHPQSPFVAGLFAARPARGRRYALLNNRLSIHHMNGTEEQRALTTTAEIRDALEDLFLIRLPADVRDAMDRRCIAFLQG
jgi:N-hydroxyarylamine O-acetyltransferase